MKVFLFLVFFIIVFIAANTLRFNDMLGPEVAGEQELTLMKESTLGIMRLFCLAFSVAATALVIPRDSEDRILYTILCKPVPRWEYLTGKLLGIMALIATVVLCMNILFSIVLELRTNLILSEQAALLANDPMIDDAARESILGRIAAQGFSWNIQLGIGSLLLESLLLCSLTLFLSVFSTSTIFSIIIALSIYLIGLFQEELRNLWFDKSGTSQWSDIGRFIFSLLFPDFRMYALMDSAINGKEIPLKLFASVGGITAAYCIMYLSAASMIFRKKEF